MQQKASCQSGNGSSTAGVLKDGDSQCWGGRAAEQAGPPGVMPAPGRVRLGSAAEFFMGNHSGRSVDDSSEERADGM